jgi:hypothetical protein
MPLRIAIFGQAAFGRGDVLARSSTQATRSWASTCRPTAAGLTRSPRRRSGAGSTSSATRATAAAGRGIPELVAEHRAFGAELNVLPYTTVILPLEIVEAPRLGSLCFHPSLLPRYRGGSAIPWQIILGEEETGVTVFRPDAGVDMGPIVVQRGGVRIADTDSAATLYFEKLYPLGIEAIVEAVRYPHVRATPRRVVSFQASWTTRSRIDGARSAREIDRLIEATPARCPHPARRRGRASADSAPAGSGPASGGVRPRAGAAAAGGRLDRARAAREGKGAGPGGGLATGERLA